MRSTIMLMALAVALGTSPTYLFAQTKADAASQDKMSNDKGDGHMSGQDKMDEKKSDDHMGSDNMSKDKKHAKKHKNSDAMSSGSH